MRFGIPKEAPIGPQYEEKRVALSPAGVRDLVDMGAQVVVESGAGAQAGFADDLYRTMGAHVVYSHEEVFGRAETVVKIGRPTLQELALLSPDSSVVAAWHLAIRGEQSLSELLSRRITALGLEVIQDDDGTLPIVQASSEIAGKMAPQIAGRLLETTSGGHGILLGGGPGIPPADVVIIGAGTLGYHAARSFIGLGCMVYVLDISRRKLEMIDRAFNSRAVTAYATHENLDKCAKFAEVLIGAVLVPGQMAPIVVTRQQVQKMRPGSVILDFAYDHGGCVETTRLQGPTPGGVFVREGVLHFAVPNCPSFVARTATHALTYALLPFLGNMQGGGLRGAMSSSPGLRRGCYTYRGEMVSPHITKTPADLMALLQEG
ncbi:MAG: alanine dehydrogenase [Acidobacteriota bacterium]